MVAWAPVHKTTLLPTVYVQHATWISYEEYPPPHHLPREVEERPSSKIERSGGKLLIDTCIVLGDHARPSYHPSSIIHSYLLGSLLQAGSD